MKCGVCDKTDGFCYVSLPPKVKCSVTGEFHDYNDECNAMVEVVRCKYCKHHE